MYVEIRKNHAEIGDPDNCQALDVRVAADERDRVDVVLRASQLGRWDGGAEAHLAVAELHARAAVSAVGPDWEARWDAMIGYARTKGWLSADGAYVRAHLVGLG